MWNMGTDTEIDHRAASVYSGRGAVRYLGLNDISLVLVVLETENEARSR